jgi:Galactosyltransferase/Glycosyl transferase family 11
MITCNLMGGLGNQLFQIAATISCAIKYRTKFGFLNVKNLLVLNGTPRHTYWDSFLDALEPFLHNEIKTPEKYQEKIFDYEEIKFVNPIVENTMLVGYFQSPKYFNNIKETFFKLIKLHKKKPDKCLENTISMHFRIGDYKQLQHQYELLPYEYYERSIQHIINLKEVKDIMYFCEEDDIQDVEKIINKLKIHFPQLTFNKASSNLQDWEQMLLMSSCKYNIIANSTFSWWGAYFNTEPDKIVCCPSKWFKPKYSTKDLLPDDWIKIDSSATQHVLLIMNCEKYRAKALIQKQTWLQNINIVYYHVIGNPNLTTDYLFDEQTQILYVKTKDDYNSLPNKVIEAYNAVLNEFPQIEYIFKTDDDQNLTDTNFFMKLKQLITNTNHTQNITLNYGGKLIHVKNHQSSYHTIHPELPRNLQLKETDYCTGRFYFLSKLAMIDLVNKKDKIKQEYFEDYAIGYYMTPEIKKYTMNINTEKIFIG